MMPVGGAGQQQGGSQQGSSTWLTADPEMWCRGDGADLPAEDAAGRHGPGGGAQ
jgi:hypothetical protein